MNQQNSDENEPVGSPDEWKLTFYPEGSEEIGEMLNAQLRGNGNHRSVAVLAGGYLEWRVRQSIIARLCATGKPAEKLLGKEMKNGELSFYYQCNLAYCLGLIGEIALEDLHLLGEIRNRFAHNLSVDSFSDGEVTRKCNALKCPEQFSVWNGEQAFVDGTPSAPITRFLTTVHLTSAMLWASASIKELKVEWPKPSETHLFW